MVPARRHARDWFTHLTFLGLGLIAGFCFVKTQSETAKKESGTSPIRRADLARLKPPSYAYRRYERVEIEEHRIYEEIVWRSSRRLNICIAAAAGLAAVFSCGTYREARRQANAAEAAIPRASLNVITAAYPNDQATYVHSQAEAPNAFEMQIPLKFQNGGQAWGHIVAADAFVYVENSFETQSRSKIYFRGIDITNFEKRPLDFVSYELRDKIITAGETLTTIKVPTVNYKVAKLLGGHSGDGRKLVYICLNYFDPLGARSSVFFGSIETRFAGPIHTEIQTIADGPEACDARDK